jgi:acyl-CoA thioester hydrolase
MDNRPMTGEIEIRVRYSETDRMGLLHHAQYLVYFEQGRIELSRTRGVPYRELEDQGYLMVLSRVAVKYRQPARFDDLLRLVTRVNKVTMVSLEHGYALHRGDDLLAEGETLLVCVDREGRVQKLPDVLLPADMR